MTDISHILPFEAFVIIVISLALIVFTIWGWRRGEK